ncbi:hypothetical protein L208DRAFT_1323845, partial [Tricholoma matsutake]
DQLKMYLGGMAGTGKTHVLQVLTQFFSHKKVAHHFVVVAPTGSAAALLNGSTYHYMFSIESDGRKITNTQMAQVKTRLEGVDYIFFDELSMLSCQDMYRISE